MTVLKFISPSSLKCSLPAGTVPTETYNVRFTSKDELRSAILCVKCNSIKPERAHHCSVSIVG